MRKERKRPQGRMGGGRKQKEMEERKRKGRVLSLWSSAGLSGVTVGRKGRKHVLAEGTGSVPRGHHTPPAAARTCLWLGSGRSVHKWKCQPFGIWGFDHQGPDAKASHPCPSPTAAFTLTPAWLSCVAPPQTPLPRMGLGQHPHSQPESLWEPLWELENACFPFRSSSMLGHSRLGEEISFHFASLSLTQGTLAPHTQNPQFTLDTSVAA